MSINITPSAPQVDEITLTEGISGIELKDGGISKEKLNNETKVSIAGFYIHELEIIELQANTSITPYDHDYLVSDTFIDANGYENSVDTGNTDATFNTDKYVPTIATASNDTATTSSGNIEGTGNLSILCTCVKSGYISRVSIRNIAGGTSSYRVDIKNQSDEVIATALTGNVASNAIKYVDFVIGDYSELISAEDTFTIVTVKLGAYGLYQSNVGVNHNGDSFTFSSQTIPFTNASAIVLTFVPVSYDDSIVQIDLPVFSGTITNTELVVNSPDTETGATITYDIVDASANTDTDLSIETDNSIVNLISNPTILKINLNPISEGANNTPSVKTYCLKVWVA